MNILKGIGTVLLVGGIIGLGFAIWLYNKPHRDISAEQADYQVTANELFSKFKNEEEKANEKYLDNVVRVNGSVKQTSTDENGRISAVLVVEGADMGGVNARFSESQTEAAKNINKGDKLSIKCRCIGYESDLFREVRLDNCSFVN